MQQGGRACERKVGCSCFEMSWWSRGFRPFLDTAARQAKHRTSIQAHEVEGMDSARTEKQMQANSFKV